MLRHPHFILTFTLLFGLFGSCTLLNGETKAVVESYKKKEKSLSRKRFDSKKWSGGQQSDLTQKTLSFQHWNKHYNSLGSKKWNYTSEKISDKKRFKAGEVNWVKKNKDIQLSDLQGQLANLETEAQISTDSKARIIQDRRMYAMMLKQAENFKDTGETLSLRDINRFQFRKNRPDGDVPTTQVGSGEDGQ